MTIMPAPTINELIAGEVRELSDVGLTVLALAVCVEVFERVCVTPEQKGECLEVAVELLLLRDLGARCADMT